MLEVSVLSMEDLIAHEFAIMGLLLMFITGILSIVGGSVSYYLSGFISRWIRKKKMVVRLLAWSIFLPISFGLPIGIIGLIGSRSLGIFFTGFSMTILFYLKEFPFNLIFLGIWLLGVLLITRKHIDRMLRRSLETLKH